ncbi:MAG: DUF4301 family protein [Syntrophales bacterium]|nr:DUF4301 family protein [Syntrophales bacterium]
MENYFTRADIRQIEATGLTVERVLEQIDLLKRGVPPIRLNRPCIINDGIVDITGSEEERNALLTSYDEAAADGRFLKFVPASGAASRMFRDWYRVLERGGFDSEEEGAKFAQDLKKFAFFDDLSVAVSQKGDNIQDLIRGARFASVLEYILTSRGLDYGQLPKALLKFHAYPGGNRTALEEHLVEAALYVRDGNRVCRLHFTVSREHKKGVEDYLFQVKGGYEKRYNVKFNLELSTQLPSTDTIAVDMENRPFRNQNGSLAFRPGGHGALLKNLNQAGGAIIFIKNIDNVVPDRLKPTTIIYKKIIGGYLITLQKEIFRYLRLLSEDNRITEELMKEIDDFCLKKLNITFPAGFKDLSLLDRRAFICERLNRPLRVCGMVKNEGEPGGGPFWVDERDGTLALQIIEKFQIDRNSQTQRAIWSAATHFNPVDLVCGVRDYRGRRFDLHQFVNQETVGISQKSEKGKETKALELPGLWNGSMHFWNTAFVEVPGETFNPVKTADDFLREKHQP